MASDSPEGQVTRKKGYVPDDNKDYDLCSIEISEAENGVVVSCRYTLNKTAKAKVEKSRAAGASCPYYDSYGDQEKHVFEDKAAAVKFINSELTSMWGNGSSADADSGDSE